MAESYLGSDWLEDPSYLGGSLCVAEAKDKGNACQIHLAVEDSLLEMCVQGDAEAQYAYGCDLLYGVVDKHLGLHWLEKAMDAGHKTAGAEVALSYISGNGQDVCIPKGISLLKRYAQLQNRKANCELGKLYYFGDIVDRDLNQAVRYFTTAAERNSAQAQDYLGDIYCFGKCDFGKGCGIVTDYAKALIWYELAFQKGNCQVATTLTLAYYNSYYNVKKAKIKPMSIGNLQQIEVTVILNIYLPIIIFLTKKTIRITNLVWTI